MMNDEKTKLCSIMSTIIEMYAQKGFKWEPKTLNEAN